MHRVIVSDKMRIEQQIIHGSAYDERTQPIKELALGLTESQLKRLVSETILTTTARPFGFYGT